jgi:hypothetical protein
MDDGEIADDADFDVVGFEIPDRYGISRLLQKS